MFVALDGQARQVAAAPRRGAEWGHVTSGVGAGRDGGGGVGTEGRVTVVAWPGRHGGDVDWSAVAATQTKRWRWRELVCWIGLGELGKREKGFGHIRKRLIFGGRN
jgi:hypothetical protein